jgi:hypothetical protein
MAWARPVSHQSQQLTKDVVEQNVHIKNVTAITEVFGDGQMGVELYDQDHIVV